MSMESGPQGGPGYNADCLVKVMPSCQQDGSILTLVVEETERRGQEGTRKPGSPKELRHSLSPGQRQRAAACRQVGIFIPVLYQARASKLDPPTTHGLYLIHKRKPQHQLILCGLQI